MTSKLFRSVAPWILVAGLAAVPPVSAAPVATGTPGVSIEFTQLNWLGNEGHAVPLSHVVTAELSFDVRAARLLTGDRGAFFNLQVSHDGGAPAWVARNLFFRFPSTEWMLGSKPSVQFALDVPDGLKIKDLRFALSVTPAVRFTPISNKATLKPATVTAVDYRVGGRQERPGAIGRMPDSVAAWVGVDPSQSQKAFMTGIAIDWNYISRVDVGHTSVAPANLPAVSEGPNGCAPGAVARSIDYLLGQIGHASPGAQSMYGSLYTNMGTTAAGGTLDPNLVSGKNAYNTANNLPITTSMNNTGMGNQNMTNLINNLNSGADVEILISWNGGSGHVAMVTSVTRLPNGSYQITFIDDPNQNDGQPGNQEHTITVGPDGSFPGSGTGAAAVGPGTVDGFVTETLNRPNPDMTVPF